MYSLEQLRIFIAAADQGSFSAAARKLGKAQSAVSQAIQNLEIDWHVQLFDRSKREPILTEQGRILLDHSRVILAQAQQLDFAVNAFTEQQETKLELAVDEAVLVPKMQQVFLQFSELFPHTALNLHAMPSSDVIYILEEGLIDMGLMISAQQQSTTVDVCYLGDLPFEIVVASHHPLAARKRVGLVDLQSYRQLMLKGFDKHLLLSLPQVSPNLWWANNIYLLREMAKQGLGWTYLPSHILAQEQQQDQHGLVSLPVVFEHQAWRFQVDRVMPKGKVMGPALSWLSQALTI